MKKDLYNKIMSSISKEIKKTLNEALEKSNKFERISYLFDLNELLPDNVLSFMSKCPLKLIASGSGFGGPCVVNNGQIELNESAPSRTYSVSEVTKLAPSKLGLNPGSVISVIFANNVETCVLALNKFDNKKFIIECMKSFGWSFSYCDDSSYKSYSISVLHFDPIFQQAINAEIKKCSLLYHWTPKYNYASILKDGLVPKSNNYKFFIPAKDTFNKGFCIRNRNKQYRFAIM